MTFTTGKFKWCGFFLLFFSMGIWADEQKKDREFLSEIENSRTSIRIYSQVLSFNWPKGFVIGERVEEGGVFMQILIPRNETKENWTQKIIIYGIKDASIKQNDSLNSINNLYKNIYKVRCPKYFSISDVGEIKIRSEQASSAFILGCGITKPVEKSEKEKLLVMVLMVQGKSDMYSIQWLQRSATEEIPPTDWLVWRTRLESLFPMEIY